VFEVTPLSSESMRKLKFRVSGAAKDVGRGVRYGGTEEGTLLVWLASVARQGKRGVARGRS
jgi:hypothetical protein